ncbi:MAG: spore coat protein [Clostridia bacterium]|nr:spore coat protein [Clostridia bacterium]
MTQLTSKELTMIADALTFEGLICKKARAYSKSLTDPDLAQCMCRIADEHQRRYNELLKVIGG